MSVSERRTLLRIAVLTVIAFVYMLWFARFSSPLTGNTGVDYDFFRQGGEFMRRGLMYSGYFDNKGPALYAINALGLCISDSKWGIFILEVISLACVLNLLWATGRRIAPGRRSYTLFGLTVMLLIYISTICGGDSVESWSLLPSSLALWIYFRRMHGSRYVPTASSTALIGACFGMILMLRANDAVIVAAVALAAACSLIARRQYRLLGVEVAIFLAAACAVVGAFCLYFAASGSLDRMIDSVFSFAYKYWDSTSSWSKRRIADNCARMIGCFILPAVAYRRDKVRGSLPSTFAFALVSSVLVILSLFRLITLTHYYTTTLPLIFLLFTLSAATLRRYLCILITIIVLLPWALWQRADFTDSIERPWRMATDREYLDSVMHYDNRIRARVLQMVPEHDRDSIYQLEVPLKHTGIVYHSGHLPVGKVVAGQRRATQIGADSLSRYVMREFDNANPRWIVAGEPIGSTLLAERSRRYILVDSLRAPARFYGTMNFYIYKRSDL